MLLRRILISVFSVSVLTVGPIAAWAQSAGQAPVSGASQTPAPRVVDQRALDELKLMSDTIAQAKTAKFQTLSMIPIKSSLGIWINLYGTSQVVMQGPDKLFVSAGGDFAPADFYFDGKTVTAVSPDKNIYAVRPAPVNINALIEEAYRQEGKSFPFADVLISEPYSVLTEGLINALFVGKSTIDGIPTNHLAFSNANVDWQIWVGIDDHLPRLVVATYMDDTSEPSYTVEFKDWKLNEPVSEETFIFQNASNAAKVEFRNPKSQNSGIVTASEATKENEGAQS